MDIEIENEADLIAMLKKSVRFLSGTDCFMYWRGKSFYDWCRKCIDTLFLVLVCYSLTLTAKRADENLLMICEQNQKIEEEKGKQEMNQRETF